VPRRSRPKKTERPSPAQEANSSHEESTTPLLVRKFFQKVAVKTTDPVASDTNMLDQVRAVSKAFNKMSLSVIVTIDHQDDKRGTLCTSYL